LCRRGEFITKGILDIPRRERWLETVFEAISSGGDVDCYSIIRKLLDFIFNTWVLELPYGRYCGTLRTSPP
jgi:hypothetical protein